MQSTMLNLPESSTKTNSSSPRRLGVQSDRFIPNRSTMNLDVSHFLLQNEETESDLPYKSSLSSSLFGEEIDECKILALKNKAPKPQPTQNEVLYTQNLPTSKPIPNTIRCTSAERILDAPGLLDDYYLNLLDWSSHNILSVALGGSVYLWNATASISELLTYSDRHVTSLNWSPIAPQYLAVGTSDHVVEVWDIERKSQIRAMSGHSGRVSSLAWNTHLLSSGSFDCNIHNHDLRLPNHHISTFARHTGEVCGLKWSPDGSQLASGGNDNLLNIWQMDLETPKFSFSDHSAAVKALAWCPWQQNLLASGGGSADRTIRFWNTQTGSCLNTIDTESQVCSIQWSKYQKELISSHGFSKNQLCIWKYPSMSKVGELTGHSQRVMHMALSPDGTTVVSGSADETLRFWRVFESAGNYGKGNVPVVPKNSARSIQSSIHKIR